MKAEDTQRKRIIVGMSGASGMPVGILMLHALRNSGKAEIHLVVTDAAKTTLQCESEFDLNVLYALADQVYDVRNIGGAIASGSFPCSGMIVIPCSMKTLAGIASGYADNLLLRAADVTLKEGRRLVLVVRECPMSAIHLRNMARLAEIGVGIFPLVMTFYNKPETIEDMSAHLVSRVLSNFGIEVPGNRSWKGLS
ncbi:MAG: UbiX family flavin prenyltransferase [Synergistaceae bacterium]|jgi:4-hydroxy-3-polyprenylbenzoate decarboxylase|nr:UbiX family flavin prenyltransferase [Synergistaceae bacterium]